jgi:hypothetical protein
MVELPTEPANDDFDAFLDVLRDALMMVVRWIERRKKRRCRSPR